MDDAAELRASLATTRAELEKQRQLVMKVTQGQEQTEEEALKGVSSDYGNTLNESQDQSEPTSGAIKVTSQAPPAAASENSSKQVLLDSTGEKREETELEKSQFKTTPEVACYIFIYIYLILLFI